MASIGKISLSVASAVAETTATLANFSFDFAIVRMEAAPEYRDVGNRLSKRRKHEAEEGRIHRTARNLGALFADEIPLVPHLEKAYGLRASELASNPSVNPQGTAAHGALATHIGLDATTVWAAATSGRGAIQVHLLACMLARQWPPSRAVAIWSELVRARKAQLETVLSDDQFHLGHLTAAQIEVSLDKLAEWDAGARAWLSAADKAFMIQQKQLMLIIDNLGRSVPSSEKLYDNVHKVWCNALMFMDKVASGMALSVESPDVLLGLSSWHLYPDMVVLGAETKNVLQKDGLVSPGAVVTIGMDSVGSRNRSGISWTIPLARLRYYGRPTLETSVIGMGSLRVPFDRLVLVAIGSAISDWGRCASDIPKLLEFLIVLEQRCIHESQVFPTLAQRQTIPYPAWLSLLADQARLYSTAKDAEQKEMMKYINLGRTRYKSFLDGENRPQPLFNLSNISIYLNHMDLEDQIALIRTLAADPGLGVQLKQGLILYNPQGLFSEVASVSPQPFQVSGVRRELNRRWILPIHRAAESEHGVMASETEGQSVEATFAASGRRSIELMRKTSEPCSFLASASLLNEEGKSIDQHWALHGNPPKVLHWKRLPTYIDPRRLATLLGHLDREPVTERFLSGWQIGLAGASYEEKTFRLCCSSSSVAVYVPISSISTSPWNLQPVSLSLDFITTSLRSLRPKEHIISPIIDQSTKNEGTEPYFFSLSLLHLASMVYAELPTATIELSIASEPLHRSKWPLLREELDWTKTSTENIIPRSQALACIARFDSGLDLEPDDFEDVIAISYRDTLYVSDVLLNFPVENPSKIHCLVGNVGKPGLALLLSPRDPELNDSLTEWKLVNHADFDGKNEDNFSNTSLHLKMTGSEMPLHVGIQGARFIEAMYVEAAVSAHYRGVWFADIDVLRLYSKGKLHWNWLTERLLPRSCDHTQEARDDYSTFQKITAIDNWPEMMELPPNTSIIRAKSNWSARLALACVMRTRFNNAIIATDQLCWACVQETARFLQLDMDLLVILS